MSKYDPLWEYVEEKCDETLMLSFEEIAQITGFALDHSFLGFKKELEAYGCGVGKISMKNQTVTFFRKSEECQRA